jgi:molybdopterin-guanine dinucleotide biosynthesis protein A
MPELQKPNPSRITATVLAGGLSRRMFADAKGAGDKGLLALGGLSMIGHVVARIRPQVAALVLNANGDPARFASLHLPVAADPVEGFVGPLAGVLAGLRWTARTHPAATHTLSVSSDAPFLPSDLARRLAAGLATGPGRIAIARSNGELQPVIGLWPVALADDLEAELKAGVRKVLRWTDKHGTVPVDFPPVRIGAREVDPFFNANTPDELDEARRILAEATP